MVGDADFKKKCEKKIESMKTQGVTIVIVSHWKEFLKKNVDEIIEMKDLSHD
jgi:ABC-type polysaccharide/polyol phosphate transport system ATPase subunit